MIGVLDAKHVVNLALKPIRRCPDAYYTFDRLPFLDSNLDAKIFVLRMRIKDVNNLEFFSLRPVNGGFISEIVEWDQVVISEERHDFRDPVLFQFNLILSEKT